MSKELPSRGEESRLICLNQDFQVFDPEHTSFDKDHGFTTFVALPLKTGGLLPFRFEASPCSMLIVDALTPFDPEVGYQIDDRDLDLQSRKEKVEQIPGVRNEFVSERAPLLLCVIGESADPAVNLEYIRLQRRLRVALSFPGEISYDAGICPDDLFKGGLVILEHFSPVDFGELPFSPGDPWFPPSFRLYLPSDIDELKQIQATFILAA